MRRRYVVFIDLLVNNYLTEQFFQKVVWGFLTELPIYPSFLHVILLTNQLASSIVAPSAEAQYRLHLAT